MAEEDKEDMTLTGMGIESVMSLFTVDIGAGDIVMLRPTGGEVAAIGDLITTGDLRPLSLEKMDCIGA